MMTEFTVRRSERTGLSPIDMCNNVLLEKNTQPDELSSRPVCTDESGETPPAVTSCALDLNGPIGDWPW